MAIEVTTAAELVAALQREISNPVDATVEIMNDIDFNNSPYYFMPNSNFINLASYSRSYDRTINGNGHTLSNIYVYPGYSFIANSSARGLKINDLTIEAILNDASLIKISTSTSDAIEMTDCVFNVRCYNLGKTSANKPFIALDSSDYGVKIINCVFNFYISSAGSNVIELLDVRNTLSSIHIGLYESCIFKIRNATNSDIYMFNCQEGSGSDTTYGLLLDNSAIFYNDVGSTQGGEVKLTTSNYKRVRLSNSYVASFGSLKEGFTKPVFWVSNSTATGKNAFRDFLYNSFYDKDKITLKAHYYSGTYWQEATLTTEDNCADLTTAQCKDPDKLTEIGYIFSSEV
jgi:hypothetical protein